MIKLSEMPKYCYIHQLNVPMDEEVTTLQNILKQIVDGRDVGRIFEITSDFIASILEQAYRSELEDEYLTANNNGKEIIIDIDHVHAIELLGKYQ